MCLVKAISNGVSKVGEIGVVFRVKNLFLNEFPEPFDEVQVRRIRGEIEQLYIELQSQCGHNAALLITGIVQHERDGHAKMQFRNAPQQFADAVCPNVGIVRDQYQFMGDRIQRTKDVEPSSPSGCLHKEPGK